MSAVVDERRFADEPVPGYPLPVRAGPQLAGTARASAARGTLRRHQRARPARQRADPNAVYERAALFDGAVDAINATDGSGAHCHMGSLSVCALLTRLGYALIQQISCRDKNRIAIQGDILGGAAMGVTNMLCLSGDGVQTGDHPEAKPVFDLDCMSLLEMRADDARRGPTFQSGRKLDSPPRVFLGAAANPFVEPFDWRPRRLREEGRRRRPVRADAVLLRRAAPRRLPRRGARARPGGQGVRVSSASARSPRRARRAGSAPTCPACTSPTPSSSASPAATTRRRKGCACASS